MGLSEREKTRFYRKLGLRLRSLRNQSGYTLEETEEHGVRSWKHLQRIESGEANITIETLLTLSMIYKVHPSEILIGL
jgi:transcriptional regulator with XRE-family HTH domain